MLPKYKQITLGFKSEYILTSDFVFCPLTLPHSTELICPSMFDALMPLLPFYTYMSHRSLFSSIPVLMQLKTCFGCDLFLISFFNFARNMKMTFSLVDKICPVNFIICILTTCSNMCNQSKIVSHISGHP